jgi:hypothetical protein
MPNWVFNTLSVSGKAEDVASIKAQLNAPFTRSFTNFEFNKETETWDAVTKDVTYNSPVFSFWNIIKPLDLEAYNRQPDRNVPLAEQLKFQGDDWYAWNVRNWGTKWDVAVSDGDEYPDTEIVSEDSGIAVLEHGTITELSYKFNTAWSPPEPIVSHLSEQYPKVSFTLEYQEEQGWGGQFTYINGEITYSLQYESQCRECDMYDCIDWDEETEDEFCKECGFRS